MAAPFVSRASVVLALAWGLTWVSGCKKRHDTATLHRAVFGGDVTLGRKMNLRAWDPESAREMLGDLGPHVLDADLAVINAEGVLSYGGQFTDKGESRPYMYRAHPAMARILADLGIDVVTVGNNHTGDYGREAFAEMLDHLGLAGIQYTGGGHDLEDAQRPAYIAAGDVVVAVVGADLSSTPLYVATETEPGTHFANIRGKDVDIDTISATFETIVDEARRHAHLVVFTPHWGKGFSVEPTAVQRELAQALIEDAGFDAVFGHSTHRLQGVEIFDGRPVVYDCGDLVADFSPGQGKTHDGIMWESFFDRSGIKVLRGYPVLMRENRSRLAEEEHADRILGDLTTRSADLGTSLARESGNVRLDLHPSGSRGPAASPAPPVRTAPEGVRAAPQAAVLESLPAGVRRLDVAWGNGVQLLGYALVADQIRSPKGSQVVALYWKTDRAIRDNHYVKLRAIRNPGADNEAITAADHWPGDWLMPTSVWPVGKVIQDLTIVRLDFDLEGEIAFDVGLGTAKRREGPRKPSKSSKPLLEGAWIRLGTIPVAHKAPRVMELLEQWRIDTPVSPAEHLGAWAPE